MGKEQKISIILPCLNEQKGLSVVVPEIVNICEKLKLDYEIVLADNNSTDNSISVFKNLINKYSLKEKNQIVIEKNQGYGSVYQAGFNIAKGDILIMADSDGTYDFNQIPNFIKKIEEGYDLVIGNRFSGNMEKDSMPLLNKFLGNPVLSYLVRLFFKVKVKDVHSGMRAMKKETYKKLDLYTKGMEFASEMIIQASKKKAKICEIDIPYRNRHGHSKLKAFRDGWKHLRFILLYSPIIIFMIPGILLFISGIIYFILIDKTSVNSIFLSSAMIILGYQIIFFAVFSKIYAINHLGEEDKFFQKLFKIITLEKTSLLGILITLLGIIFYFFILQNNLASETDWIKETKIFTLLLTFIILGVQTVASAFMLSILGIKEK